MSGARADGARADDAAPQHVERDDLAARRVGDVRVAAVRMRGRVARLAEAAEDVRTSSERPSTMLTAPISGWATTARSPTVSILRGEPLVGRGADAAAREVDDDEPRLEVGGHEDDVRGPTDTRKRPGRQRQRSGGENELPTIHNPDTPGQPTGVPLGGGCRSSSIAASCNG